MKITFKCILWFFCARLRFESISGNGGAVDLCPEIDSYLGNHWYFKDGGNDLTRSLNDKLENLGTGST